MQRIIKTGTILVALLMTSATAAQASGTLQAYKGGYRNAGDNTALNYAKPLAGAGFEHAPSASSIFTPFPSLSDANGLVSKSNLSNGGYKVRETSSPSGWNGFSQLHWNGSNRDYVGTASLNDNTRIASIESTTGGTTRRSERFVNAYTNPPLPTSCNIGLKVLMLLDSSGSTSGFNDAYRGAAQTFVNELYGTNTKMKISSFATTIDSGNATTYDLSTSAGKTNANNRIQSIYPNNTSGSGFTNWDAILQDASQANVDAVVFITDGNPTVRAGRTTGSIDTGIDDITYAIASANLAKNPNMNGGPDQTVLGVGVGTDISEVNMRAVTGPNKGTDYVISPTPTELTEILKAIAGKLCPGQLTLTKKLVPSDDPGLFDLKVDGEVKKADAGNGGTTGALTLDAGSHTIGEAGGTGTSLSDYSSSTKCTDSSGADVPVTDGKINLATDAKVTCVITNTRNTGEIKITKSLSPTSDPGKFNLLIGGTKYASDVGNGGTTGYQTLNTGSWALAETAGTGTSISDYNTKWACEDSQGPVSITDDKVNLGDGQKISCTVTNTRQAGSITVNKSLSPSTDPGLFNLLIGGKEYATDIGDGGTTGKQTLNTGSWSIAESAGKGTNLSDYATKLACEDEKGPVTVEDGKVTLSDSQNITCLFTNTRETGEIKLTKQLSPSTDPGLFNLLIGGTKFATDVGDGGTTGYQTLNTGSYLIEETAGTGTSLSDYNTQYACEDSQGPVKIIEGKVELSDGQQISCTANNTRKTGTITVNKGLSPSDDPGLFNLLIGGKEYASDIGDGGSTGKQTLNTGSYLIEETAGTGTSLSDYATKLACQDEEGGVTVEDGKVTLSDSQNITCLFTNTRNTGTIKLVKQITPSDDPGLFDLQLDGSTQAANVGNGGASETLTVNTGSHTVSEAAGTGTSLSDYTSSTSCEAGGEVIGSSATTSLEIEVGTGQAITCTFTNLRNPVPPPPPAPANGTIIITKNTTDGSPGSFSFTGDLGSFSLSSGSSTSFSQPAGSYAVAENTTPGYTLSSLVCSDAGETSGSSSISGSTALINLQSGETVVCTFTNAPGGGSVLPAIAGSARVSGSQGCVTGRYAYVRVRGANIDRVSYFISGKRVKTLTERNSRGRYYELRYPVRKLKPGQSKRVTAQVQYLSGASPETATLRWRIVRCAAKKPNFTG